MIKGDEEKMKKLLRLLLVAMLVFSLVAVAGCAQKEQPAPQQGTEAPAQAKVLKVGTQATYPPFEFVDKSTGEFIGFDMDLIRAIAKVQGYEVDIQSMGFDALIPSLQADKVDVTISAQSITEERLKAIDFSDPYFQGGLIVAVRADNTDINGYDDLAGKRLAAEVGTIGAAASEKLKEKDPKTQVRIFDGIGEAFMELEKGGADGVINDWAVTNYYMNTDGKDKIKVVGDIFEADDKYGIGVKKGDAETLKLINEGLAKLKESGEFDQIYKKWFSQ